MIKGFDNKKFLKDFDILLKKYKIEQGFLIARNYNENEKPHFSIFSEYPDDLKQKDYSSAIMDIFKYIGIDIPNMKAVAAILNEVNDNNIRLKKSSIKYNIFEAEKKLSETDLALLKQYRKIKNEYVLKQNYEMASKYRKDELSLLNIKL